MALKDIVINIKTNGVEATANDMRKVRSVTQQMADGIDRMQRQVSGLIGGFSLGIVIKQSVDAALAVERIESAMKATYGSGQAAARELQFIREEAERLGLVYTDTATAYAKFSASTKNTVLEGEAARKIFSAVSEAVTAMKLSGEESNGIFLALSQMMSKGKISAEELTGQLGERLPGATKLVADALGLTTQELLKQMQEGRLMATDVLPRLAEQLHLTYGAAAAEAAQGGQAEINRFTNALFETRSALGTALLPTFTSLLRNVIQPLSGYITEFIGGLEILAVKFAALPDKARAAWEVIKSGEGLFSTKGLELYERKLSGITAAQEEVMADIIKKYLPGNSSKTATDKAVEAARIAAAKAAAAKEAVRAAEAETKAILQRDTAVTTAWNRQQDHLRETAYWLSDHDKAVTRINIGYENQVATLVKTDPLYRSQLATLGEMKQQSLDRLAAEEDFIAMMEISRKLIEDTAVPDGREEHQRSRDDAAASDWKLIEGLKQERSNLQLNSRDLAIQTKLRELSTYATAQQREEVAALVAKLYDEREEIAKWKQVVDRIDQTFHDGFVDMLERGKSAWSAFTQSLANTFKSVVSDAIYAQFAKPIVLSVVASSAGALGVPGLATAATNANSPISTGLTGPLATMSGMLGNLSYGVSSAMSMGITDGFTTGIGLITAPGGLGASGIAAGIGMMLPAVMAAAGAGYMIDSYFGSGGMWNQSTKDQKWMRGASLATFMAPALLDWATGGGLFGTKWKTTGGGVSLGVEDGEAGGWFYTDQQKKKKWFKGNQYSTTYSVLDRQWEEFIDMQYDSIINAMKNGASMMGKDGGYVDQVMQSFSSAATKINLAGLSSEDQQKAVADYFRKITNEALLSLYPELEASIRLGEDAAAAWERMNALRKTNNALLMQELELLGQKDSAGYMDLLNQQREMELLNMDASTQAIQRRIWALQDEKSATEKLTETYSKTVDIALSAANALRDIMGSNLSALSPEAYYRQQQASFAEAMAAGRLADLPELGKTFLTASRAYNASGSAYMSDYDTVTRALAGVAGMVDDNPTLTAVQRQVSLLEEIRELLQVGNLTAIAGFSGKLAPDSAVGQAVSSISDKVNHTLPGVSYTGVMDLFAEMQAKISNSVLPMGAPAPWSGTWQYEDGSTVKSMVNKIKFDSYEVMVQDMIDYAKKYHIAGYANGGITSGLSFAGEAGPEAVVPLPDGRTIPVRIQGSADNYSRETIRELQEQNKLLREVVAELKSGTRVAVAVGTQLVDLGEESNQEIKVLSRQARMASAK